MTTDAAFSPDGTRLVLGRFDGRAVVYDTLTRRQVLRIDVGSVVTAVAFRPAGNLVAVGTIDGEVRFFDPKSGALVGSLVDAGSSAVWQLAFNPDGRLLAVVVDPNGKGDGFNAQQRNGEVQLWDGGLPEARRAGDQAARRIRALRRLQPGRARCSRPAATADGSTSGMSPPARTMASRCGWRTMAS